jgi:hypothetical protein
MFRINNLRCKFSLFSPSSCNTILIARSFAALLLNFPIGQASSVERSFTFYIKLRSTWLGIFYLSFAVAYDEKMRAEAN